MKQMFTDMADVLKGMNEMLEAMQKTICSRHDTILFLSIERMNAENCCRNVRIESL